MKVCWNSVEIEVPFESSCIKELTVKGTRPNKICITIEEAQTLGNQDLGAYIYELLDTQNPYGGEVSITRTHKI